MLQSLTQSSMRLRRITSRSHTYQYFYLILSFPNSSSQSHGLRKFDLLPSGFLLCFTTSIADGSENMQTLSIEALTALLWGFTALDIILTAGRFVMHWRRLKKIRVDDVFNGIALVFLLVFMITWQRYVPVEYLAQLRAAGLRKGPLPPYDPIFSLKVDFANLLIFWCTLYAVKASFLALYWQIFAVSRRFRLAWTVVVIYVGLSFAISILAPFWHCGHPSTLMDPRACHQWKSRAVTILYMTTVLHLFGDILLVTLPLTMLRSLQMRMREKIGLAFIFGLVLIDIAFAILRVVFTITETFKSVPDRNTLWSSLDPIVAVMVCTLPCYRSVLSFDRTKPIIRTPHVSFHSSNLTGPSKISSLSTHKAHSVDVQMEDLSSDRLNIHNPSGF
ncbi:hypothetical protein BDV96DRAFT_582732 [Lophiotrema nucula]|uniref:Rhodopsin domain-containing protein n=1 Tax=Lophiotrema nucula TaxID=690887 RepID=A0A6A5YVQ0_9PLEO|nr:hypothetical protein BDV96DRAFT_582732 [Lophiotrema nucula]